MNLLAKNLLILASAGSGKTFQLSNRIIALAARGVPPERMVALTFTRKAAGEFTDALLTKLASAANNPEIARVLADEIETVAPDFTGILRKTVRALPRVSFGTMDGFFAKIVRSFQYELGLTGGRFELLEGPRAESVADDLLGEILGDSLHDEIGETFFHAFRRSLIGREQQGVLKSLRGFVGRWQTVFQEFTDTSWGPAELVEAEPGDWEAQKRTLARAALDGISQIEFTDKRQSAALERAILAFEQHTIGSGSLGSKAPSLLINILEACAVTCEGPLEVKFQKTFSIDGRTGVALRRMVTLAAACEFAAALARTRAIRDVVSVFDALCAKRLRQKGMLGFNEVKLLMGEWVRCEEARLRREAVDFRLDSRHDHWLLDEFQDTSQAEWRGLQPLIDEAASSDRGSLFVVGDKKQAIYAWRGGDIGLFDEIVARYGHGLEIASMAESWRSSPEVLSLVNRICGDMATLHALFGEASSLWQWQRHVSAVPLQAPANRGYSMVGIVGGWDERLERTKDILTKIRTGERNLSCGILLRGNQEVRDVAEYLRGHGFDVIEEGHREPTRDNPPGALIFHLLNGLANPADAYSKEVIAMSPLYPSLRERYGPESWRIWENLTRQISNHGFAPSLRSWLAPLEPELSDFGRLRVGDILSQLSQLDAKGEVSPREAVEWLRELELSQSPGSGAIQVMTIHKSKGLGFDVVILPQIPDTVIPQSQYFDLAFGNDWVSQTPPKWARSIIPELRKIETQWEEHQRYESFCLLYVALTRAKRGLYILLDEHPDADETSKASLARWVTIAAGLSGRIGANLEFGNVEWATTRPTIQRNQHSDPDPALGLGIVFPETLRPSQGLSSSTRLAPNSPEIAHTGNLLHRMFERISWTDITPPVLPDDEFGKKVRGILDRPEFQFIFHRGGRMVELFREQPLEISMDSQHVRAVIDRLHLHRDSSGNIHHIEIFDYKTGTDVDSSTWSERHAPQVSAYRQALKLIHPAARIDCYLILITPAKLVRM